MLTSETRLAGTSVVVSAWTDASSRIRTRSGRTRVHDDVTPQR